MQLCSCKGDRTAPQGNIRHVRFFQRAAWVVRLSIFCPGSDITALSQSWPLLCGCHMLKQLLNFITKTTGLFSYGLTLSLISRDMISWGLLSL